MTPDERSSLPRLSLVGPQAKSTQKVIRAAERSRHFSRQYLQWSPEVAKSTGSSDVGLRRPTHTVSPFEKQTGDELGAFAIDPSRGAIRALGRHRLDERVQTRRHRRLHNDDSARWRFSSGSCGSLTVHYER